MAGRAYFSHPFHLLLLAAFAVAAYLPSFDVPFLFDDLPNLVYNPYVQPTTLAEVPRAIDTPIAASRPVAMLSFALNHLAGQLDPFGYHVVNLALHVVNGALLYTLLLWLAPPSRRASLEWRRLAFWAALLWLLHPVQTQAVTFIVQRMTSLATLFYLAGLLVFVLHRRGRLGGITATLLVSAAFLLGMGSKEIVATLPFACLLIDLCFFPERHRQTLRLAGVALIVGVALAMLYLPGLPDFDTRYPNRAFTPLERLLTEPRVLWHYLSLLAWPLPERLHLDFHVPLSRDLWTPTTTLPAIAGLLLMAVAGEVLRKRLPLASFALLFFLLASVLEASFVNLEIAFIHRIYLPGLFLFAGLLTLLPSTLLARGTVPLLLLAAALALATVERNREWRDETRFWALDLERGASPFRAMMNRGAALMDLGRAEEAARLMTQSLPLLRPSERMQMEIQIAGAWYSIEDYPRARTWLERLRQDYGDRPEILFHLAELEVRDDRPQAAEALLPMLRAVPSHRLHARLVEALVAGQRHGPEARIAVLQALRDELPFGLDAQHAEMVDMHLADAYLAAERHDDAYAIYLEATERRPSNYFAWRQLYRMQRAAGDSENAARIARFLEQRGVRVPP